VLKSLQYAPMAAIDAIASKKLVNFSCLMLHRPKFRPPNDFPLQQNNYCNVWILAINSSGNRWVGDEDMVMLDMHNTRPSLSCTLSPTQLHTRPCCVEIERGDNVKYSSLYYQKYVVHYSHPSRLLKTKAMMNQLQLLQLHASCLCWQVPIGSPGRLHLISMQELVR
jgi:hypothetical protein